jgi:hypothetical protein
VPQAMAARLAGYPDIRAFVPARAAEGASLAAISGEAGAQTGKNEFPLTFIYHCW